MQRERKEKISVSGHGIGASNRRQAVVSIVRGPRQIILLHIPIRSGKFRHFHEHHCSPSSRRTSFTLAHWSGFHRPWQRNCTWRTNAGSMAHQFLLDEEMQTYWKCAKLSMKTSCSTWILAWGLFVCLVTHTLMKVKFESLSQGPMEMGPSCSVYHPHALLSILTGMVIGSSTGRT